MKKFISLLVIISMLAQSTIAFAQNDSNVPADEVSGENNVTVEEIAEDIAEPLTSEASEEITEAVSSVSNEYDEEAEENAYEETTDVSEAYDGEAEENDVPDVFGEIVEDLSDKLSDNIVEEASEETTEEIIEEITESDYEDFEEIIEEEPEPPQKKFMPARKPVTIEMEDGFEFTYDPNQTATLDPSSAFNNKNKDASYSSNLTGEYYDMLGYEGQILYLLLDAFSEPDYLEYQSINIDGKPTMRNVVDETIPVSDLYLDVSVLNRNFNNVVQSFFADKPEKEAWIYTCNVGYNYNAYTNMCNSIRVIFIPFIDIDKNTIEQLESGIEPWMDYMLDGIESYRTDEDKYKFIHDRLCDEISYDYDRLNYGPGTEENFYAHSIYGVIYDKTAVCEGYAEAYKMLCNEAGLPCYCQSGFTPGGEGHEWNIVSPGNSRWYYVDTTWDDSDEINISGYTSTGKVYDSYYRIKYNNFLCGTNVFSTDGHEDYSDIEINANFNIPRGYYSTKLDDTNYFKADGGKVYLEIISGNIGIIGCDPDVTYVDLSVHPMFRNITENSFSDCRKLGVIKIPSTVKTVEPGAFSGCRDLIAVMCERGSAADDPSLYPDGVKIVYGNSLRGIIDVAPPKFTVKGIFGGRNVTFNSDDPDTKVYYTTESRSTLTTDDLCINPGTTVTFNAYYGTLYARAYKYGQWSNPARLILRIPKVNDPTITKLSNGKVKIKTTTPSCIVYYTTDGSVPSASNYAGKFWTSHDVKIPAGKTVKAIAVRSCFSDSKVTTKRV